MAVQAEVTCTRTHALAHTRAEAHSHSSLTHIHILTHTHNDELFIHCDTLTPNYSHIVTCSHTHTHLDTLSHSHTYLVTHIHTYTQLFTYVHTHTHSVMHPQSHSVTHSFISLIQTHTVVHTLSFSCTLTHIHSCTCSPSSPTPATFPGCSLFESQLSVLQAKEGGAPVERSGCHGLGTSWPHSGRACLTHCAQTGKVKAAASP